MSTEHAFVVAAYRNSPYLEACLDSLASQTVPSPIVVSTSTPHVGLPDLAARHGASLHIHTPNRGIGADWNSALGATKAQLITIVHQDDVYEPQFTAAVLAGHRLHPRAGFSFVDADEITPDGRTRKCGRNLRIKRWLVGAAFTGRRVINSRWRKRILLGFGNPILCPGVTFNRALTPDFAFREDMRTNMDWLAWLELARNWPILRLSGTLLHRRVHEGSETAACLDDGTRQQEDEMVFRMIWPRPVGKAIAGFYRSGYTAYLK